MTTLHAVPADDFSTMDDDALAAAVSTLAAHIHAATYRLLVLIAELDRREVWAAQGALSCAHWLSWACGIDTHTAREKVRVARALTAYAAGLRASELGRLQVSDIDSARMCLRVNQGKGSKDRYVPLSPRLLEQLREYWRRDRPQHWLFPTRPFDRPMSATAGVKWHEIGQVENAAIAGWTRAVPWPLGREEDEISKRC